MSIYSGSRRGWKDVNDVVQPIPRRDQQAPVVNGTTALRDVNDWTAFCH